MLIYMIINLELINLINDIDDINDIKYIEFIKSYIDDSYDELELLFEKIIDKNADIDINKEKILKLLITIYLLNKN